MAAHCDLYFAGVFVFPLAQGESTTLCCSADQRSVGSVALSTADQGMPQSPCGRLSAIGPSAVRDSGIRLLVDALDQFIVTTDRGPALMTGYPWLGQMTYEILTTVPGLLAAGQTDTAETLLLRCAATVNGGAVADALDMNTPSCTNLESTLRLFHRGTGRISTLRQGHLLR